MSIDSVVFGYLAGFLSATAYIPYVYSIIKRKATPSRASWIIWSLANLIILPSYFMIGDIERLWMPLAYAIGSVVIMSLSFRYGTGGWTRFDKKCFVVSLLSLGLWWYFDSPLLGLLMNLAINAIGSLPTIKKVYKNPKSESWLPWSLFFVGSSFNLLSLIISDSRSLASIVYSATLFASVVVIMGLILFKKQNLKEKP
ncbi:MAG TPA: hypothetical protein PKI61_00510 [bacterium]|nr:hypothetical protein [bacterium]HPT29373.1 hypothetical protein [bacterium]